jgi:hypothetical protein
MTRARRIDLTVFVIANVGAIIALVLLCVTLPCYRAAQKGLARGRVREIDSALVRYRLERNRCPVTRHDLVARGVPPFAFTDPWGTSIATWCSEHGPHVMSAGPDKVFNTSDDIASEPWPLPREARECGCLRLFRNSAKSRWHSPRIDVRGARVLDRGGSFFEPDMSSRPQPTLPGEPAPGLAHRRGFGGPFGCPCPPTEPRARAAGVDHGGRAKVLPKVLQHVDDRRTHLARRPQGTAVVPVAPDAPTALRGTVDRSGAPPGQTLESSRERLAPVRLDHEMNVISLNREVDEAKVRSIG